MRKDNKRREALREEERKKELEEEKLRQKREVCSWRDGTACAEMLSCDV